MLSGRPAKIAFEPARTRLRHALAQQAACGALVMAICTAVSIPAALAQTDSSPRIAMQNSKPKARVQSHKSLDSDALYVCTLSGFGNLAHCYPR